MSDKTYDLIISVFDGLDSADKAFDTMKNIADGGHAVIHDAAVVVRNDDGKIKLDNKGFVSTGKGGAIGFGVGLLLGGPLGGAAIGALVGFARSGDRRKLREMLNSKLGTDQSALALVLESADWERVDGAIGYFGGEIVKSELTQDAHDQLKDLMNDEDVKAEQANQIIEVNN